MQTYQEAKQRLGSRDSRKLENNTYLKRRGDTLAVMLHATDVVTYFPNGDIQLNSGGWRTMTTKDRINKYAPIRLWAHRGQWYIAQTWNTNPEEFFKDGMIIHYNGTYTGAMSITQAKAEQKLRERVRKYASAYLVALKAGKIDSPSGGDCWYCFFTDTGTGKPLGEVTRNSEHLLAHIRTKYYVPSLAWNALKAMGASQAMFHNLASYQRLDEVKPYLSDFIDEQIEKAIRRYVYRELGLAY
jgi:hypothetical protein